MSSSDLAVEEAARARDAAGDHDPPPALVLLGRRFGLTPLERDALLLCAALELDPLIADLCGKAQRSPDRPYPTFALFAALFDDARWELLSPERPLRYWRFLEINQPGAEPLTTSPLRADERIVSYIKGVNYLDDRLTPYVVPVAPGPATVLPPSQSEIVDGVVHTVRRWLGDGRPALVQLVGGDPSSKELVAERVAQALDVSLYRLAGTLIPRQADELETLARLWRRESNLLRIGLYLDAHDHDGEGGAEAGPASLSPVERFLARSGGIFFVSVREPWGGLRPDAEIVEVHKPSPGEQQAAWVAALGDATADSAALLAGQFDLDTGTIERIARTVRSERTVPEGGEDPEPARSGDGPTLHERLWTACLVHTGPRMHQLAERLHPTATWEDIVLPDDEHDLLRQLANQVARRSTVYDTWGFRERMNRGLGISALFTGESGTGKTMAAEVIANHLRLDLYRIDLSAVVSKYIGETEKNLRRLFDAAEAGGALLFFDEADALFGKRSEVRDSHDRYANIEINYLLQRMEAYRGLAILASNMKSALDPAFMRRLRFIVTFPFPGRAQRRAIWERAWPPAAPLGRLDFDHLARFNLTGGSIANVALNAAFMAARDEDPVTMRLVLEAVRAEFRKLERPCSDADFTWEEPTAGAGPEREAVA
jgi:hypothetical protein